MFYMYVLQSQKDKSTYIGFTKDLRKRFEEHTKGKSTYTKSKRPLTLIYYEGYTEEGQARKREIELKRNGSEKEKLYKRIFE